MIRLLASFMPIALAGLVSAGEAPEHDVRRVRTVTIPDPEPSKFLEPLSYGPNNNVFPDNFVMTEKTKGQIVKKGSRLPGIEDWFIRKSTY